MKQRPFQAFGLQAGPNDVQKALLRGVVIACVPSTDVVVCNSIRGKEPCGLEAGEEERRARGGLEESWDTLDC